METIDLCDVDDDDVIAVDDDEQERRLRERMGQRSRPPRRKLERICRPVSRDSILTRTQFNHFPKIFPKIFPSSFLKRTPV